MTTLANGKEKGALSSKALQAKAASVGAVIETSEGESFVELQAIAPMGHHWLATLTRSVVANVDEDQASTRPALWKIARASIAADMADGLEACSGDCDHDDDEVTQ